MAWIESHQTLREHPKTIALMEALKLDKPRVIGHLHLLWWWCVDYAQDGRFKAEEIRKISRAAGYMGDARRFVDALLSAGFLDQDGDHVTVHDWDHFQYHYRLMVDRNDRKRVGARERQRKKRAKNARHASVTESSPHTVQYQTNSTVPNQPNQTITPDPVREPKAKELVVIPEDLKANEAEVQDWLAYKREKGQTYKGTKGLEALWRMIRAIPVDQRRAAVDHSMANNYSGLFMPKGGTNGKAGTQASGRAPASRPVVLDPGRAEQLRGVGRDVVLPEV